MDDDYWLEPSDTEWRRGCRWLQSWWRETELALPAGPHRPPTPGKAPRRTRPVTSTLPLDVDWLPRIQPLQDLRHTHATLLLVGGEHLKVVQERLGHHSGSFTSDAYQHVTPGMDDAAAARFDGLVFGDDDADDADDAEGSAEG